MSNGIILNKIIHQLKILNTPNIIYVLKGFNFISKYLSELNFLFSNSGIILNLEFDTKNSFQKLSNTNETFFIWYEDLILLEKQQKVGGIKDFTKYSFKIIENDLFFNYYPDFEDSEVSEKLLNYNSETDNVVQLYYGDFLINNGQGFFIYNDITDKNIEIIKISETLSKIDTTELGDVIEIPEEIDNISFAVLVKKIFLTHQSH